MIYHFILNVCMNIIIHTFIIISPFLDKKWHLYCFLLLLFFSKQQDLRLFHSIILLIPFCNCIALHFSILHLFNQFPIDRHLGPFPSFPIIINILSVNRLVHISFCIFVNLFWNGYFEARLLGHRISACVILQDCAKFPSVGISHFILLPAMLPHSLSQSDKFKMVFLHTLYFFHLD